MKLLVVIFLTLTLASSAAATGFQAGIAEPGVGPIPAYDVSSLGLGIERRSIAWHGETTFSGAITWTPGLRAFASVWGGYPNPYIPSSDTARRNYCSFVVSVLRRYPQVHDVIIWNEPNLSGFWAQGADAYAHLIATCSPTIRAAGARVWASMSPSTVAGVSDFARHIAAAGPHIVDGWSQHDYANMNASGLGDKFRAIRAAFSWKVPILIGESGYWGPNQGGTIQTLMSRAYCLGAIGWLNFNLRDDGDWQDTGLRRQDGSRKPAYSAFQGQARTIAAGRENCGKPNPPPVPPAPPRWTPDQKRAQQLGEIGGWARDAYER